MILSLHIMKQSNHILTLDCAIIIHMHNVLLTSLGLLI